MKTMLAFTMLLLATATAFTQSNVAPSIITIPSGPTSLSFTCGGTFTVSLDQLTKSAIAENRTIADDAVRMLRARGPEGLQALLDANAEQVRTHALKAATEKSDAPDPAWERLRHAIDSVSQQRDCYASRLFWYTDFEQAKVAAKASYKPILSLRLLGKLDEEFSCANSRYFRTTLYANQEVAKYLQDHFILHWKSVRPVPKVTIDFGDGRKLEQTITGNSIHYILNADGELVDALPGLYGPQAFQKELQRIEMIARKSAEIPKEARAQFLAEFHDNRLAELNAQLAQDLKAVGGPASIPVVNTTSAQTTSSSAGVASVRAASKRELEAPLLRRTAFAPPPRDNDEIWAKIGDLHADSAKLDKGSRSLIAAKAPTAVAAGRFSIGKSKSEAPLLRQIRNLERSISEDTARNEYLFHTRIHEWLATQPALAQIDTLNRKVYAELFLTPDTDPWLGLLPDNAYSALENDGIVITTKQ